MNTTLHKQLAIFSGSPAFEHDLHVGRPNIGNRDRLIERINDMLDRRWFTNNGPLVQEFEQKIAAYTGTKHCIATCNATIALEITIRALGLKGEVIVPSFTFIATAHALQFQEITPTFCDVGENSHHLDPARVKAMITPRTTGIIGVHVWGEMCDIEGINAVAKQHNLRVIYDAAHAFGCSHQGKMVGGFGDAEVFSFHATKFLNSFEGGAVTTNNDELATKLRYMRNFGFAGYDNVEYIGTNAKMTEVCAAMGLTSLEDIDELIAINRRNYDCYVACLQHVPGVKLMPYSEDELRNYQYIILEIDAEQNGINRNDLVKVLHAENILARRYFYPGCHQMEPYRSYFPHAGLLLPRTEQLTSKVMSLPNGSAVEPEDIERVCAIIDQAIQNGPAITTFLKEQTN
jgi:dTDP-4-amino-4,6-dideoxygalactose transaminase